jgi:glutamate racemase
MREINELYPQLELIDPAVKLVDNLATYLKRGELLNDGASPSKITLFTTAETYEYAAAIKRLKLEVDALIKVNLDDEMNFKND